MSGVRRHVDLGSSGHRFIASHDKHRSHSSLMLLAVVRSSLRLRMAGSRGHVGEDWCRTLQRRELRDANLQNMILQLSVADPRHVKTV
ncbi:hypothetical protein ElyMa_005740000 [Elysia marginata]|uniref:Uncharacterized protein n=1 Tax=Elysia marginata TaxID=1093978 RepID=A0AAV4FLN0_9GAST|nr:hypothetical protein ElyMa_005740000 [Elysia marginata]